MIHPRFTRPAHHLRAWLLACAVVTLVACGGGGEESAAEAPAPVLLETTRTARATLGAAGGSLSVTAADGRRYTLTVPPGALATNTEMSATPVVSMGAAPLAGGLKGAVRFAPAGLRFALPATLRIEGANPVTNAAHALTGFVRSEDGASMQLVLPHVVGSALELEVPHFSDVGVSEASATELITVPADAKARPEEALADEYMREVYLTDAARAAGLIRLHDARVAPRLTQAEFTALSTPAEREEAVAVARVWLTLIVFSFDTSLGDAALPGGLAPVVSALRLRVLALLSAEFEAGRTACMAPAPIGIAQFEGLEAALRARQAVFNFRFVGGLPGLDADTAGRRLNDCVRVAFVPRALPALEIGRPVSLDARAQLVFAADPNAALLAAYAFNVTSSSATVANPEGLADIDGQYTTVVTPTAANPVFNVKACMMVALNNGGDVTTELCGQQTVGGAPAAAVWAGEVRFFSFSPRTQTGSVRLRLSELSDGRFAVLEALGSNLRTSSGTTLCFPFPADGRPGRDVATSFSSRNTITGGQQFEFLLAGRFIGFQLTGSTVIVNDEIQADCSIKTVTTTTTNAGSVQILRIERDALSRTTALVFGDSTNTQEGRLVLE